MSALIVPMNVCALVVGKDDDTTGFARLTYNFDALKSGVYLAESVRPHPFDLTDTVLPVGVHLHWALPAALTQGTSDAKGITFLAPPNRWLVVRLGPADTSAWVVESDCLADTPPADPQNQGSRSVPAGALTQHLGRVTALADWTESNAKGYELTAVGFGLPSFAAAYPHAPNVFGMWDPADGLAADPVTYLVAGWHSSGAEDPVGRYETAEALAAATGWTLAGPDVPERMLCAGAVTGVPVDLDSKHLPPARSADLEVAVGHTGVEALSALLAARDGGSDAAKLELALNLLQEGILSELERPNGLAFCADRLHTKRFHATPGGTRWTLERPTTGDVPAERPPLPDKLADTLKTLNARQSAADAAQRKGDTARSQLFADWCKYLEVEYGTDSDPKAPPRTAAAAFLKAAVSDPHAPWADATTAEADAAAKHDELTAAAKTGFVLEATPAERFWRPVEPVVLLSGDDLARPDRYGRDGQTKLPFTVLVRTSAELPAPGAALDLTHTPFAEELGGLIAETTQLAAGGAQESLAFAHWSQPWIPLLLDWELEFTPDSGQDTYASKLLIDYRLESGELVPAAAPAGTAHLYSGTALLANTATLPLGAQIDDHLALAADDPEADELRAARADLGTGMLAQALSGLGDAFLMRHQGLQLPVHDPRAPGMQAAFTKEVASAVGSANDLSAMPRAPFSPLRAGRARLTRLRIVDAFGQVRELDDPSVIRSAAAKPSDDPDASEIWLPARLQQGARLNFRWISAQDDAVESCDAASSPVCGWLLFNRIEDSLAVYAADGVELCSLHTTAPVCREAPGDGGPVNAHLKELIDGISHRPDPAAFLDDLFEAIDATLTNVATSTAIGSGTTAALVSRPLALVRAQLDLELLGQPAVSQSWSDFTAATGGRGRSDAGISGLEIPVALGDRDASDDGLIGFWRNGDFIAHAAVDGGQGVRPGGREDLTVRADPAAPPVRLTMIVDPNAGVYAATGLLPRKRISIPPAMYAAGLRNLTINFAAAPVLMSRRDAPDRVGIPVPTEPGFTWKWLTRVPGGALESADVEASQGLGGRSFELADGWLALAATESDPTERN